MILETDPVYTNPSHSPREKSRTLRITQHCGFAQYLWSSAADPDKLEGTYGVRICTFISPLLALNFYSSGSEWYLDHDRAAPFGHIVLSSFTKNINLTKFHLPEFESYHRFRSCCHSCQDGTHAVRELAFKNVAKVHNLRCPLPRFLPCIIQPSS